jgi:hypothetical protein
MPVHTLSPQFCPELLKHDLRMTLAQRSKELVRHGSALGDELANTGPLLAGKVSIGRCACPGELNGRASFHAMVSLLK